MRKMREMRERDSLLLEGKRNKKQGTLEEFRHKLHVLGLKRLVEVETNPQKGNDNRIEASLSLI